MGGELVTILLNSAGLPASSEEVDEEPSLTGPRTQNGSQPAGPGHVCDHPPSSFAKGRTSKDPDLAIAHGDQRYYGAAWLLDVGDVSSQRSHGSSSNRSPYCGVAIGGSLLTPLHTS